MNQYKILSVSSYALDFLHKFQQGTIHSVYRKTINIDFNRQLLAIQAKDSPLSPISLITEMSQDDMEKLPLSVGQAVRIEDEKLLFFSEIPQLPEELPTFALSFQNTDIYTLRMYSSLTDRQLDSLTPQIFAAILQADTNGFDLIFSGSEEVSSNLMMLAGKKRLQSATDFFHQHMLHPDPMLLEAAAQELIHLIGLGIGLTPSGDDFLTGICAGLLLCHKENTVFADLIHRLIREHLSDTNDISGAFLSCALEGEFSQSVNSLWQKPEQNSQEILESFSRIGHSSGIDSLCGIFYVLKIIRFL